MKYQFDFLSYVDYILIVYRSTQGKFLIFTFMSFRCFLKQLFPRWTGQFFWKKKAYEQYKFH